MKKLSFSLLAILIMALNSLWAQDVPSTYTYKVGEYEVVLLSEGQQNSKPTTLIGATPEQIVKTMPDGTYASAVNAFLIKTPQSNILIDAGFGRKLFDNLASVGVAPEQVDMIFLTHMHGDHIGGLLRDGKVAFPNAKLHIAVPEAAYWTSEEVMKSMPENRRGGFVSAQNVINAYKQDAAFTTIELLDIDDAAQQEGITSYKAFGHTPGHTMFLIKSKGEQLLIWGDLTHVTPIQMPYPEISVTYDVDPKMAAESRKKVLEFVTANKVPVAGMHIAFPAIGKVEEYGKGYKLIPAKY